jgi:pyridoxine 5-phosphate synthase
VPAGSHLRLGVNIDHVATIRNARGGRHPDPVRAAMVAIEAGADGITAHLREDRRHISDDDIARLTASLKSGIARPLNLEMAATDEMIGIATRTRPHAACLVPERRAERTTEGGLDAAGQRSELGPKVAALRAAGIRVSLFIAADPKQIDGDKIAAEAEWQRIRAGAKRALGLGLEVHAGHGLDYASAEAISSLPEIAELNIGHFLIGEAVFTGLSHTVKEMRAAMDRGRARVSV